MIGRFEDRTFSFKIFLPWKFCRFPQLRWYRVVSSVYKLSWSLQEWEHCQQCRQYCGHEPATPQLSKNLSKILLWPLVESSRLSSQYFSWTGSASEPRERQRRPLRRTWASPGRHIPWPPHRWWWQSWRRWQPDARTSWKISPDHWWFHTDSRELGKFFFGLS